MHKHTGHFGTQYKPKCPVFTRYFHLINVRSLLKYLKFKVIKGALQSYENDEEINY